MRLSEQIRVHGVLAERNGGDRAILQVNAAFKKVTEERISQAGVALLSHYIDDDNKVWLYGLVRAGCRPNHFHTVW